MILNFTPRRIDVDGFLLDVEGDVLYVNGDEFDFGPLNEGDILPASAVDSPWFEGEIRRTNGAIVATLMLPHGANAPEDRRFPQPINVTEDGSVNLPPYDIAEEVSVVEDQLWTDADSGTASGGSSESGTASESGASEDSPSTYGLVSDPKVGD